MNAALQRIRGGDVAPVYVLFGNEPGAIGDWVRAIRAAALVEGTEAFNHERFDGKQATVRQVLEACQQLPVMASHRLVELSEPEALGKGEDATRARDAIVAYIKAPAPTTVLLISSQGIDGRSKFVTAAKKTGVVQKFAPLGRDGDAIAFVRDLARDRGAELHQDAAAALVAAVGTSMTDLSNALERAELHAGEGRPVTLTDVDAVVSRTRQAAIFDLTDAVGMGQRERAMGILASLFHGASEAEYGQAMAILSMLVRQVRLVFTAKMTGRGLQDATGVPPFVARKLTEQARRFDEHRLRIAHASLVRLDADFKGGAAWVARSPVLALQRWILDVCGGVPGVDPRVPEP